MRRGRKRGARRADLPPGRAGERGLYMVQAYYVPQTVEEAAGLLEKHAGKARIMAGGTDLVLDIKDGKYCPEYLVDITKIKELKQIEAREQTILIGAGVTHNQAAASALVQGGAACLAQASSMVGSHQIRNSSTLAGNVVNAQPAADSAVALVALGARARILTGREEALVPVEELYAGFGKSHVDSSKSILTGFLVPAEAGTGSGYMRLQQRKALALPMLCVAAWIRRQEGTVKEARIAMAPVGVGPVRAAEAEHFLLDREGGEALWSKAGELALKNANPRDSLVRGSRKYRLEVLPALVREALSMAWEDAGRKEEAHG